MIDLALFLQLATSCAPRVASETLAAVARTESSFNEFAIHDNVSGRTYTPATKAEAVQLATAAVAARRSVDLGLMQINSANLPRLGLTVEDAFDPCRSLAAADRVLVEAYAQPLPSGDQQAALHQALSRYNTGSPVRGLQNGYVSRVQASAEHVVPAIRLRGDPIDGPVPAPPSAAPVVAQPLPPPPASWDVYGQARAAKGGGTAVFGAPRAAAPPPVAGPPGPVQLRAAPVRQPVRQALNEVR